MYQNVKTPLKLPGAIILTKLEPPLTYRVIFSLVLPLKVLSTEKFIWAWLGVSKTIYVNVD